MPKLRRPVLRNRRRGLASFRGTEAWDFMLGWRPAVIADGVTWPPLGSRTWATWAEFFQSYGDVRGELFTEFPDKEPWAEQPYWEWRDHGTVPEPGIVGPSVVVWA